MTTEPTAISGSNETETAIITSSPASRLFWVFVLAIVLATAVAYANSFDKAFVFDDIQNIIENPAVRTLWPSWKDMQSNMGRSRPVVNFTLAINYAISGYEVWSYHVFNLLIHIVAALTLFGIVHRTLSLGQLQERYGSASTWLALSCALIWAVHPLNTQAVTYIIQRCESLMGLFFFLTLYCAIRGWQSPNPKYWQLGAIAACLLGVGSKEVIAVAPIVVFLYDLVFIHHGDRPWQVLRKSWLLYGGLAFCIIALGVLVASSFYTPAKYKTVQEILKIGRYDYNTYTLSGAALAQIEVIFYYLKLTVWPNPLVLDYYWHVTAPPYWFLYAIVFLILIAASARAVLRRRPSGVLAAWFFLILSTTSIPAALGMLTPLFEHRMYLPLASLVTAAVIGLYTAGLFLLNRGAVSERQGRRAARVGGIVLLTVFTLILGSISYLRNRDYQSEYGLWVDTAQKRPKNVFALSSVAGILYKEDKPKEASTYFQKALDVNPEYLRALTGMGACWYRLGDPYKAISYFQKALDIFSDYFDARAGLGAALFDIGRRQEGLQNLLEVIRAYPQHVHAQFNLGVALRKLGKQEAALQHFREVIRIQPKHVEGQVGVGAILLNFGRTQEAIPHFQEAVRLEPDQVDAHTGLGAALIKAGSLQEGIGHLREAIRINPDHAEAHYQLGLALSQQGQPKEAIEHFREAIRIQPDYEEAHFNLGVSLETLGRPEEAILHFRETLRIKPDHANANYHLGLALVRQNKLSEAVEYFQQVLKVKPDSMLAHYQLGKIYFRQGQSQEAIHHFQEAVKLEPKYAEAHFDLGIALAQSGRFQEAVEHYQAAAKLKPEEAAVFFNLGLALLRLDKWREAIPYFEKTIELRPNLAEAHLNLGIALSNAGQVQKGLLHVEDALKIKPGFVLAQQVLKQLTEQIERH